MTKKNEDPKIEKIDFGSFGKADIKVIAIGEDSLVYSLKAVTSPSAAD